MKKSVCALFCVCLVLLAGEFGCAKKSVTEGDTDKRSRLIFYTVKGTINTAQFSLRKNYGMMVFYDDLIFFNSVRFKLFVSKSNLIIETGDLDSFLEELAKIPKGETLDWYDTCSASTFRDIWHYDDSIIPKIKEFCKKKDIRLIDGEENMLCICMIDP